jgi:hypothetical protein
VSKQKFLFDVDYEAEQTLRIQRIVNKRQLSKFLGISERLIEFEMAAGRLPYLKVGRRAVRFDLPVVLESFRNRE